eukprot:jgi/Tetstr1/456786/TSEL_004153.t1
MKVIAKKFRGVWHYGVITGVVTEWVLEDYGGATQWRAVFEDGSGKVTVQSGWVMEDCLHHMETFSILNAGPLLEEARVKAIMTEKELRVPRRWTRLTREGRTRYPDGAKERRPGQRGAKPRRRPEARRQSRWAGSACAKRGGGQRGAKQRRPAQRGAKRAGPGSVANPRAPGSRAPRAALRRAAKPAAARASRAPSAGVRGSAGPPRRGGRAARRQTRRPGGSAAPRQRRPGQARRQGAAAGAARRQGAAAGAARRQDSGGRGSAAPRQRRPGQRGAKTAAAGAARRQDSAYSGIGGKGCITSCGRQPLKTMRSCRNNPSTGFWIPLIWLTAAGCGMQGRMTEVAVLVSPQSLHAAEAAQPHRH